MMCFVFEIFSAVSLHHWHQKYWESGHSNLQHLLWKTFQWRYPYMISLMALHIKIIKLWKVFFLVCTLYVQSHYFCTKKLETPQSITMSVFVNFCPVVDEFLTLKFWSFWKDISDCNTWFQYFLLMYR